VQYSTYKRTFLHAMGQYVQEQDISSNSGGGAHAHTVRRWYKRLCEGGGAKVVRMWLEGGVAAAVRRWGCEKKPAPGANWAQAPITSIPEK
jgi:hypothetical protein